MATNPSDTVDDVLRLFEPAEGRIYLDSSTYGLPPKPTIEALRTAADDWQAGTARWIDDWDREGEACRALFARLIGVDPRSVSLQPAVSVSAGLIATAVPAGGEVLLAEEDFTSVTYPFLAARDAGRLRVRAVPLAEIESAITASTDLVAVSLVQSADGRAVDPASLRAATDAVGAQLFLDGSQALGMLPFDARTTGADYVACAGYKWLCCPRGASFLYVRPDRWTEPWPASASWRGGDDPYGRFYGVDLGLAADAARFDVSLAWHAWVGARTSLETLLRLDDEVRYRLGHDAACRFAAALDLPAPAAGIVQVPVADSDQAAADLERAGIRVAARAGKVRAGFHLYNTLDQADEAAEVLRPHRV